MALSEARLEFDLLADFAGDSLRLREAKLRLGELPLEGSGAVRSLGGARELDFAFASDAVEISHLLAAVPGDRFSDYDIAGSIELSLQIGGSLAGEGGMIWSGLAKLENVSSGYGGISDFLSDGKGTISFESEAITLHQFEARVLSRPFQADLTVTGFDDPVIEGRLEGEFDLASVARLREGTPPISGTLSFTIGLSGPIERREQLRFKGPIRLSGVTYPSEKLPAPARIDGTVDLTGAGVIIEDMAIAMGNSDFTLSLESDDLLAAALATGAPAHVPSLRFSLRSERFDLGEFPRDTASLGYASLVAARLAGRQLGGRDPSQIAMEKYKGIALPPVNARGRVSVAELVNPPNDASDIAFDVEFVDGVLQLKNLRARLYGGEASGSFSLDASGGSAPFPVTYALKLEDARAGAFLDRWTRLGEAVSGRMDFEIAGSTTLDESLLPAPDAIEAQGHTVFKDGRFLDLGPANALIDRFKLQDRISSAFQYLGGPFRIENGRFLLDAWRLTAGELKANIDGAAGLGGSLDLSLGIDVPRTALQEAGLLSDQSPLGGLLGQLAGDDGAIRLSLGIGGTMSQPQLRLDTESLEAALRNQLQDAGRGLLDRLLKKKN